jgi:hypothetical protein
MSLKEVTELDNYSQEFFVEEDEMGDSGPQDWLVRYLVSVLEQLYRHEQWMITVNRHHYHPLIRNSKHLIIPDIAVFKGIPISPQEQFQLKSWRINSPQRPAPPVVFEISSNDTWQWDIGAEAKHKPATYGRIGVQEFFAFDPNEPAVWRNQNGLRLLGWRYEDGQPIALQRNERGWLWSAVLESWLGEEGLYLRLYDRQGQMRLKKDEAEAAARQAEAAARQSAEQRAEQAEQRAAELQRQLDQLRGQIKGQA